MLFELSKLVGALTHPANWMLICVLLGFFLPKVKAKRSTALVGLIFLIFSNKLLFSKANAWWSVTENSKTALASNAQAAFIFGGGVSYTSINGNLNFNASGDRMLEAIRLYRMGKIKTLYFSGESLFRSLPIPHAQVIFENYLTQMDVDLRDVIIDPYARNTAENIKYFNELLRPEDCGKPILAISSGWHLPRIMRGFKTYDLDIVPYAVDVAQSYQISTWCDLWPSWKIVQEWQTLIKEMVGYAAINIQLRAE